MCRTGPLWRTVKRTFTSNKDGIRFWTPVCQRINNMYQMIRTWMWVSHVTVFFLVCNYCSKIECYKVATGQGVVGGRDSGWGNFLLSQGKLTFWGKIEVNWNYDYADLMSCKAGRNILGRGEVSHFRFLDKDANLLESGYKAGWLLEEARGRF